jgi:hypothetical protein
MKILLVCAAFLFRLAAQSHPGSPQAQFHEIPLLDCSGLPCLEMISTSGKTIKLVIDTAEPNSFLDIKVAQTLDPNVKPIKSGNDTDISQVQQTTVAGARIGDLPMGDFPFMAIDTSPDSTQPKAKDIPAFPADGALGFRAFENRILQIDYTRHRIRLSEPLDQPEPCPQTCTDLIIKHFGNYGPVTLTTTGFSVNGQPLEVQLDTQFSGTILVYPDWVKKLGLKKLAKAKHKGVFPFLQGGLKLAEAEGGGNVMYQSVQLGQDLPLYFFDSSDEHTDPVNFGATVGSGLFARCTAVFDLKGKKFWVVQ